VNNFYKTLIVLVIIFSIPVIILVAKNKQENLPPVQFQSGYELTPTQAVSKLPAQKIVEPDVSVWEIYNNDNLQFKISYPKDWHQQEYKVDPPYGGKIVAFSPNNLPCSSCSYVRNGYFSIRVFDQTDAPGDYNLFLQRLQSNGGEGFKKINFGGGIGILTSNTISVEHENKVFEMSLDNLNKNNMQVLDSKLFQKFALSLAFTNLQFR
jgi:hypothetical protein